MVFDVSAERLKKILVPELIDTTGRSLLMYFQSLFRAPGVVFQ